MLTNAPDGNAGTPAAPISAPQGQATIEDDAFFASVLDGDQDGSPATGDQTTQQTATPADDATKRYEYWQGQADRYRSELDKIKPVADEYNRFAPVVEYLKQNPDVFEKVANMKERPAGQTSADTLPEPVAPTRPANYDPYSNDPGSESYKYRIAKEEYTHQLTEYMFAKQKLSEKQALAQQEQMRVAREQQAKLGQLQQDLVTKYGFSADMASDFVRTMDDPSSMSLDNMINLYKVIKHRAKAGGIARNQSQQNQFMPPPPPTAGGGGNAQPQVTDEDSFMQGIGSFGRRTF